MRDQVRGLKRRRTRPRISKAIRPKIAMGAAIAAAGMPWVSSEVSAARVVLLVGCGPTEARGVRTVTSGWQVELAQIQLSFVEGSHVYAGARDVLGDVETEDDAACLGVLLGGNVWLWMSVAPEDVLETRLESGGIGAEDASAISEFELMIKDEVEDGEGVSKVWSER
jgi:hypothetical protein